MEIQSLFILRETKGMRCTVQLRRQSNGAYRANSLSDPVLLTFLSVLPRVLLLLYNDKPSGFDIQ